MTLLELEERIAKGDEQVTQAQTVVMIQCVGCRDEQRNYCSRVCCSQAVKNALKLKEINPDVDIYVLFRDMRTYGFREDYYREASERGVTFIRYEPEDRPQVEVVEDGGRRLLRVTVTDPTLGLPLAIDADVLALAAAVVPSEEAERIGQLYKVPLNQDGFFKEAHVKLRPVEFDTEGVYLCGTAHYPKHIQEVVNQAYGAAGRVLTLLSHDIVIASGVVAEVEEKRCIGCGACVQVCAYGAVELRETKQGKKAMVNPIICKGDGLCNAVCPAGAISLKHFTDEEVGRQIDVAFAAM